MISLVICTRNRAAALERCLGYVAALSYAGAWELVVVDNGSTDATAEVVAAFARRANFPVRAVTQPIKGLSNARNAGVESAAGDIVMFTDDDCYVAPDLLDAVAAAFADPSVGFATGRVTLFDPADAEVTINESTTPLRFAPRRFLPAGAVKGANLAFRRAALADIAERGVAFDPLFGSGALFPAEDADAAQRAALAGWAGVYDPALVVAHHHGRKPGDLAPLHRDYDVGRGAFHAKLLLARGGLGPGLRAWAGLRRRAKVRRSLLGDELHGAIGYWRAARLAQARRVVIRPLIAAPRDRAAASPAAAVARVRADRG